MWTFNVTSSDLCCLHQMKVLPFVVMPSSPLELVCPWYSCLKELLSWYLLLQKSTFISCINQAILSLYCRNQLAFSAYFQEYSLICTSSFKEWALGDNVKKLMSCNQRRIGFSWQWRRMLTGFSDLLWSLVTIKFSVCNCLCNLISWRWSLVRSSHPCACMCMVSDF